MGSDMVAALSRATTDGRALFGHNSQWPAADVQTLVRKPGRTFAPGQVVRLRRVELPQVRQTWTVLAGRPAGLWGYDHGVNEHGVAIGLTQIWTRLRSEGPGLDGQELTRLALERATCARQALDVLTDLVSRHGQGAVEGNSGDDPDSAFMIVDGQEAFVLEAAGNHWAEQEVKEVRAVGGLCHVRQDWDRISRGLSDLAIARGWWAEDGRGRHILGVPRLGDRTVAFVILRGAGDHLADAPLHDVDAHISRTFIRGVIGLDSRAEVSNSAVVEVNATYVVGGQQIPDQADPGENDTQAAVKPVAPTKEQVLVAVVDKGLELGILPARSPRKATQAIDLPVHVGPLAGGQTAPVPGESAKLRIPAF